MNQWTSKKLHFKSKRVEHHDVGPALYRSFLWATHSRLNNFYTRTFEVVSEITIRTHVQRLQTVRSRRDVFKAYMQKGTHAYCWILFVLDITSYTQDVTIIVLVFPQQQLLAWQYNWGLRDTSLARLLPGEMIVDKGKAGERFLIHGSEKLFVRWRDHCWLHGEVNIKVAGITRRFLWSNPNQWRIMSLNWHPSNKEDTSTQLVQMRLANYAISWVFLLLSPVHLKYGSTSVPEKSVQNTYCIATMQNKGLKQKKSCTKKVGYIHRAWKADSNVPGLPEMSIRPGSFESAFQALNTARPVFCALALVTGTILNFAFKAKRKGRGTCATSMHIKYCNYMYTSMKYAILTTVGVNSGWISQFSNFRQSMLLKNGSSRISADEHPSRVHGSRINNWKGKGTWDKLQYTEGLHKLAHSRWDRCVRYCKIQEPYRSQCPIESAISPYLANKWPGLLRKPDWVDYIVVGNGSE